MNKKSILLILIVIASSCASKKTITEYKDRIVNDTIIKTRTEVLVERFTDTLTINQPCDSSGVLKPFKQLIKTKQGNITLTGLNNVITAEIDLKAYKEIWEKEYISKYDSFVKNYNKEVIKYRVPFWVWIYVVASALIIFLLLKIR